MVIVLVSTICVCPYFLSCITGLDVLDKTHVSNETAGGEGFQEDPVLVNYISCLCLLCGLCHGKAHF